jgi:hypothetical protein
LAGAVEGQVLIREPVLESEYQGLRLAVLKMDVEPGVLLLVPVFVLVELSLGLRRTAGDPRVKRIKEELSFI